MKKIISLFLALLVLAGAFTGLTSCGAPEDAGAEISVYLGEEIYDFDPTDYYVNSNAEMLMSMLFEPLFRIDENGKLQNAAASKYTVDEEENKIVIELRETYWSDEVQVKADDYIYAWRNRILDPNRANPAAALFYDVENAVEVKNGEKSIYDLGAVATGVYEITITYRDGADYNRLLRNLASVATSPVRNDITNTADAYWTKIPNTVVTNGPFKIAELSVESKAFTIERNMGYHQRSTVTDYTKNVTPHALVSFVGGAGEELPVSYADLTEKTVFYMLDASLQDRADNKANAKVVDDFSTYTYVFNVENELFAIPEVRRALSLAIDRNAMANVAVFASAAESFLSSSVAASLYGNKELPLKNEQNMKTAKALISSVASKLDGVSKSFTLTVNNDAESVAVANLAISAWRELGFDVELNAVGYVKTTVHDAATSENIQIYDSEIQYLVKNASYGTREFDVIGLDWQMYSEDALVALSAFTSFMNGCGKDFGTNKNRTSIGGWWNVEYDTFVRKAYIAKTPEERADALIKAEAVLLDSCPVIPVLYNQNFSFQNEDISGVTVDGYGNFGFAKIEQKDYHKYLPEKDTSDAESGEEE